MLEAIFGYLKEVNTTTYAIIGIIILAIFMLWRGSGSEGFTDSDVSLWIESIKKVKSSGGTFDDFKSAVGNAKFSPVLYYDLYTQDSKGTLSVKSAKDTYERLRKKNLIDVIA